MANHLYQLPHDHYKNEGHDERLQGYRLSE